MRYIFASPSFFEQIDTFVQLKVTFSPLVNVPPGESSSMLRPSLSVVGVRDVNARDLVSGSTDATDGFLVLVTNVSVDDDA